MTRYTVDSEAVAAAAATITATVSRLQTDASALHSGLSALESTWTGQAATAFQGVVQQWRATQANLEQVLSEIDQALRTAGSQYLDVELANARLFL